MRTIPLTKEKVALVDDADYDWLSQWEWSALQGHKTCYAVRMSSNGDGKQETISMHREILKPPQGFQTDHKDRNGLNNCRSNLRIATRSQNLANRGKRRKTTSKFKGISWKEGHQKWVAQITANGKHIHLGYFDLEESAADAYDAAALKYFGEFALTNVEESLLANAEYGN